jgi:hypothetical protein
MSLETSRPVTFPHPYHFFMKKILSELLFLAKKYLPHQLFFDIVPLELRSSIFFEETHDLRVV